MNLMLNVNLKVKKKKIKYVFKNYINKSRTVKNCFSRGSVLAEASLGYSVYQVKRAVEIGRETAQITNKGLNKGIKINDNNSPTIEENLIQNPDQIPLEPTTKGQCCVIFSPFEDLVPILTVEQKGLLFITILMLFAIAFYKNKNIIINRWLDGQKKYEKVIGAANFLFLPLYFELLEKQPLEINQDLLQFYSVFPVLIWLIEPLWGINNKPEKTEVFSKIKVYLKVSSCIIVYFCMWFARLFG